MPSRPMARHSLSKRISGGHFVPPSASLGVFGHSRDSCGFVSPRNGPPLGAGTFGSLIYPLVQWRAVLLPNKRAKAISSRQVVVWAFLGMSGTRADSCRHGMVRHPALALLAASYAFPSDGAPFSFQTNQRRPFRPAKC